VFVTKTFVFGSQLAVTELVEIGAMRGVDCSVGRSPVGNTENGIATWPSLMRSNVEIRGGEAVPLD
jgi:hypothetical protein